LKKSIAILENMHNEGLENLSQRMNRLANATKAVAEQISEIDEKVENLAGDQATSNGDQDSEVTANRENAKRANKLKVGLEKFVDSASTRLLNAYCQAADQQVHDDYKPFEQVVLSFRKASGSPPLVYLTIELSQVDVTSYSLDSGSGTEPPRETLTLSCETFKITYKAQDTEGRGKAYSPNSVMGWNFETNKPI